MTSREWSTTGGAAHAAPSPPASPLGPTGKGLHAPGSAPNSAEAPPYEHLSPKEQQRLFALVGCKRLAESNPLSSLNGSGPAKGDASSVLARLVSGAVVELSPVPTSTIQLFDADLDAEQREAVAGAIHTPDVFLLRGLPGTGKSRVLTEIILQAARRGERVLLAARSAGVIDHLLQQIGRHDAVFVLRCSAPGECLEQLPPSMQKLTLAARLCEVKEGWLTKARHTTAGLARSCQQFRDAAPIWSELLELAVSYQKITANIDELQRTCEESPQTVESLAATVYDHPPEDPFNSAITVRLNEFASFDQELATRLAHLARSLEDSFRQRTAATTRWTSLHRLAEAGREARWWQWTWWKARFYRGLTTRLSELERQKERSESELAPLETEIVLLGEKREYARQAWNTDRAKLILNEVSRRQGEINCQIAALREEQEPLRSRWNTLCGTFPSEIRCPQTISIADVEAARQDWLVQLEGQRRDAALLEQAIGSLASCDDLPRRLRTLANLYAGTATALVSDAELARSTDAEYDLLIVEQAEQFSDSEFQQLARHAPRWILAGMPEPAFDANGPSSAPSRRLASSVIDRIPSRHSGAQAALFARLWRQLQGEVVRPAYKWMHENGRLRCQLRHLDATQRTALETEWVADSPNIEIRILTLPHSSPQLAEIVFPLAVSIVEAKGYVYRELGEAAVEPFGPQFSWIEEADRVTLRLGAEQPNSVTLVPLEPGVHEILVSASSGTNGAVTPALGRTCRIEFDRRAGWDRERAREWAWRHLRLPRRDRTMQLEIPYRMQSSLAAFVNRTLDLGEYRLNQSPTPAHDGALRIQLIAVPPTQREPAAPARASRGEHRSSSAGSAPRSLPKTGAGLELDLADPRHRQRLSPDLRAQLPSKGFVNYPEAQEVIRVLLSLQRELRSDDALSVGVIALDLAQAELIRWLIRESKELIRGALRIEVRTPAECEGREWPTVLLSLTRSHANRAVAFGDGPESLVVALTRARSRLLIVGDPGTLHRRTQWAGPVDHLDAHAAHREREILRCLLSELASATRRWREGIRA